MNKEQWGRLLLRSLISGQVDQQLSNVVGELLLWFAKFNARKDYLSKKCVVLKGSEKNAKLAIVKLLDQLLLSEPDDIARIFGKDCLVKQDKSLLKLRFQRLIKVFHPDRGLGDIDWLSERTVIINGAYKLAKVEIDKENAYIVQQRSMPDSKSQQKEIRQWIRANGGNQYWEATKSKALYWFYQLAGSRPSQARRRRRLMIAVLLVLSVIVLADVYVMLNQDKVTLGAKYNLDVAPVALELPVNINQSNEVVDDQYTDEEIGLILDELLSQTSADNKGDYVSKVQHKVMNPEIAEMFIKKEKTRKKPPSKKAVPKKGIVNQKGVSKTEKVSVVKAHVTGSEPAVVKVKQPLRRKETKLKNMVDSTVSGEGVTGAIDFTKIEKILSNSLDEKSSVDNDVARIPRDLRLVLNDLELSFSTQSASDFVKHFTDKAFYFGERGSSEIKRARELFFQSVSETKMQIRVENYKQIRNWHFMYGVLEINYNLGNRRMKSCSPFSMLVSFDGQLYEITSITKYSKKKKQGSSC